MFGLLGSQSSTKLCPTIVRGPGVANISLSFEDD